MSTVALTIYVLIWPVLVAVIMAVIGVAFVKEWRHAKRTGEDII